MIACTTPERIIPEHTIKLYRFEELSAEAKAHALDEWCNGTDFDLYNVDAEDESTWEDIYEALKWLDSQIAISWKIDAYDHIFISLEDPEPELDIYGAYVPQLKDWELWAEYDIYAEYQAILPTLKIATYAHGQACAWIGEAQSEAEKGKAFKLKHRAQDAYAEALKKCMDAIGRTLTKDAEEDTEYHRSEEYFAEVATSCADLWFDAQGNQEDIPADATVEEH